MQNVIDTIIPIFAIIVLGALLRARGLLPSDLIGPLNRLVYYIAIPCLIFSAVAEAPLQAHMQPALLAGTLVPVCLVFGLAWGSGSLFRVARHHMGTFVQISFHGNLGYIGLAVCFYFTGEEGFTRASILAGFLMLLQNFLAVVVLQACSGTEAAGRRRWFLAEKIVGNPVIGSALAGMVFSAAGAPLPTIVARTLAVISGMALPLALLVIGASLSFGLIRHHVRLVLGAGLYKLLVLPATGLLAFGILGLPPAQYLPAVILLATPTATVCYVMAGQMGGSADLATAAVSLNTLLSCLTFVFWLGVLVK